VAIRWLKRYATEKAENAEIMKEILNPQILPENGKSVSLLYR